MSSFIFPMNCHAVPSCIRSSHGPRLVPGIPVDLRTLDGCHECLLVRGFQVGLLGGDLAALDQLHAEREETKTKKADAKSAKAAKSAECSKEADAKGLHGKERKKFRESCKMGKM